MMKVRHKPTEAQAMQLLPGEWNAVFDWIERLDRNIAARMTINTRAFEEDRIEIEDARGYWMTARGGEVLVAHESEGRWVIEVLEPEEFEQQYEVVEDEA